MCPSVSPGCTTCTAIGTAGFWAVDPEAFLEAFLTGAFEKIVAGVDGAFDRAESPRLRFDGGKLVDGAVIPGVRVAPIVKVGGPAGTFLTISTDLFGLIDPAGVEDGLLPIGLVIGGAIGGLLAVIRSRGEEIPLVEASRGSFDRLGVT